MNMFKKMFHNLFCGILPRGKTKSYDSEAILKEKLARKTEELKDSRTILMNMLTDIDVSRRKTAQETKKTEAIIANFTDGLLMFDSDGKVSLVNRQAEIFLKIKAESLVGKTIKEINDLPKLEFLASFMGDKNWAAKREITLEDGLILELSVVPIAKEKNDLGTLMVLHDITREKMIERMKSEFVSLAAHQLRTPLSAAKWSLRMLLDGEFGPINKQQEESLKIIYDSNERIINLINDLLDVTSIEEGKYLKNFTEVDMVKIIKDAMALFSNEAVEKKVDFEFHEPGKKLPQIMADSEKIGLAVQNLMENAIRYSFVGGTVKIFLSGDRKEIKVDISDVGIGIPKHQQARVFSKFFRATNATKTETRGTGLGLFLTKNIIEAHGGKIWFESKENHGTNFHFTLPAKS